MPSGFVRPVLTHDVMCSPHEEGPMADQKAKKPSGDKAKKPTADKAKKPTSDKPKKKEKAATEAPVAEAKRPSPSGSPPIHA